MKPDKDILEHKKKPSKTASKEYFDQTKHEIWDAIQREQTPARSIRARTIWLTSGLSAAAAIALIVTIWNFSTSSFKFNNTPQVAQGTIDSSISTTADQIPDDYYANNFELETIEEVYYSDIQIQEEIVDDTSQVYEDYLLEQNIDESIILDELL